MSRVSDALRRATEEGVQLISQPSDDGTSRVEESISVDAAAKGNGQVAATTVIESSEHVKPSLGTRIQSLLFGRGLGKIKEYPLVTLDKHSATGEQFKILREQIKRITNNGENSSLAVMSPVKGDGKTTVAANLAAVIALHFEQQVVLIDADFRGPTIHHYFGINVAPGLADYLSSESSTNLINYIQSTAVRGLRIIPAGRPTALSSELLATERMKSLLKDISTKFPGHLVIIDTPPVLSTSDPLVLAQQVDKIFMVVRAGITPRECVSEAIKLLGSDRVKGLILNGAELSPASKYYYYYRQSS